MITDCDSGSGIVKSSPLTGQHKYAIPNPTDMTRFWASYK
uniref:Uncharacterized protein n=1 Tax=Anguilla anguilla TaxID=7936 RepID=A0A0E9UZX0_ANGAN